MPDSEAAAVMASVPESGTSACVVKVRLFAGLRERAGWGERLVRVEGDPATPLLLWRQLRLAEAWSESSEQGAGAAGEQVHPSVERGHQANEATAATVARAAPAEAGGRRPNPVGVSPDRQATVDGLPVGVRVAVNQAFAAADTRLADGDELAFLPPISGG
jgi:molybdopterin converting factor small subunit